MSCDSTVRSIKMKADETDSRGHEPNERDPLGHDTPFVVALIILAALVVILWFMDPAHRPHGESRVDWPPAQPAKP